MPARVVLWGRVAALAYASPPPYAHELYGRPAPTPAVVTRRLRAAGCVGPGSRPSVYKLRQNAAILDNGDASGAR